MASWRGISMASLILIVLGLAASPARAVDAQPQTKLLASTPPMGWNSWGCYGPSVTEKEVKANADYMAKHLAKHGWQYVVVDIHSVVKLYAQWGVDYIKADDMSSPYHGDEIAALSQAIEKCGRPIVLSLSPGPAPLEQAEDLKKHAQLWRISGDFWDNWKSLKEQFSLCRAWASHTIPGHWPDADMLPLGRIAIRGERGNERHTNFTQDEQFTHMTLWSIFRSPLMFGGDLPSNDAFTLALLTNDEVLAVDQHSIGNHELFAEGNQVAWVASVPNSRDKYLALFNLDDPAPATMRVKWTQLNLSGQCAVRDLWQHKDLGNPDGEFSVEVRSHGARLFRIHPLG